MKTAARVPGGVQTTLTPYTWSETTVRGMLYYYTIKYL